MELAIATLCGAVLSEILFSVPSEWQLANEEKNYLMNEPNLPIEE